MDFVHVCLIWLKHIAIATVHTAKNAETNIIFNTKENKILIKLNIIN